MKSLSAVAFSGASLGLSMLACCTATSHEGWWERHTDVDTWAHAAGQQVNDPLRLIPQASLLFAAPVLVVYDRVLERRSVAHPRLTDGNTYGGNVATVALGATALGVAAGHWMGGDSGSSFEVLAESLTATMATTGLLKLTIPRSRPGSGRGSSFPSGHTAFAFSTATWLARSTWDSTDTWWRGVGFLSFLPAAYVGMSRIEGNQHYPSDVAVGAFVGAALTNWIYDAHVGDPATGRDGLLPESNRLSGSFAPVIEEDAVGVAWSIRF